MPRTTAVLVRAIMQIDDAIDLTPFIEAANMLVTAALVTPDPKNPNRPVYDEIKDAVQLAIIEKWTSAHFAHILAPQTYDEEADQVIDRFDTKVDLGLKVTRYGQQAMLLDTKGIFAMIDYANKKGGPIRAGMAWLGRDIRTPPPQYAYPLSDELP